MIDVTFFARAARTTVMDRGERQHCTIICAEVSSRW